MTIEKSVLGIVPGLQATALVGQNVGMMKKIWNPKTSQKNQMKALVGSSLNTMVGVGLMKPTSQMINDL